MNTITVTLGRNIGSTPMSKKDWINFRIKVQHLFTELYVNAASVGVWQGVKEESRVFVGTTPHDIETLERILARLAKEFNQDAIGLIVNSRSDSLVYKLK